MKPFVFMCLTIIGSVLGLAIGLQTYRPTQKTLQYSGGQVDDPRPNEKAIFVTLFTLAGAAVGAGFGWAAVHIEKIMPKE